jgi:hypothetical protein
MVEIESTSGQVVRIGPHTLGVLEVHEGEVVFVLLGPDEACDQCGKPLKWISCPTCEAVKAACPDCVSSSKCPRCEP